MYPIDWAPGRRQDQFYNEPFARTHTRISKDAVARSGESTQLKAVDERLTAGESVVIDNTNSTRDDRAKIIAIARARGARVIGYFFDVTTRAAVARNANRTGRDKVPNVAIFRTAKRLQSPTNLEGFDELHGITIKEERSLAITKT